jgi:hypothetical protein
MSFDARCDYPENPFAEGESAANVSLDPIG